MSSNSCSHVCRKSSSSALPTPPRRAWNSGRFSSSSLFHLYSQLLTSDHQNIRQCCLCEQILQLSANTKKKSCNLTQFCHYLPGDMSHPVNSWLSPTRLPYIRCYWPVQGCHLCFRPSSWKQPVQTVPSVV